MTAPIPGSVWKITVNEGSKIKKGDVLAVLESMKMEFTIESEYDGVLKKIFVRTGQQINAGQMIAAIGG